MLDGIRHVHFIGVGGAGMSGIARVLCELGFEVTGSDLQNSETVRRLQDLGAVIHIGHKFGQIGDAQIVVVSTAIPADNEELREAMERDVEIWPRAKMLGAIMGRQKGIAVAGAHGKTTTTSMISMILERTGKDPSVVVGGELHAIGGNAKLGYGDYLVAEADESDGSFLHLDPQILVVTNIEDDHLDYYGSIDNIVTAFRDMIDKVPDDGLAVLCADDDRIRGMQNEFDCPIATYGLNPAADYRAEEIQWRPLGSTFTLMHRDERVGTVTLHVPGLHNIKNALAAIAVCLRTGLEFEQIAAAIEQFRGAGRRFQLVGDVHGIRIFDDYAHHPSELKATLSAAKLEHPGRLIAIFQPHRYTRTKFLHKEFGSAFADADYVILTDIYSAGETPLEGVHTELILKELLNTGHDHVEYIAEMKQIASKLVKDLRPDDLVLTMGAGNIWQVGPELVAKLKQAADECIN